MMFVDAAVILSKFWQKWFILQHH